MDETLWGKWGDGTAAYPLVAHLIDAAAVAEVLVDTWLPPRLLDTCGADLGEVRQIVVAGAGLHDVGKATPVFQGQLLSRRAGGFDAHLARLAEVGLPVDVPGWAGRSMSEGSQWWVRRHEVASAVWAAGQFEDAGGTGLAAVLAGHHGRWRIPEGTEVDEQPACRFFRWWLDDPAWHAARQAVVGHVIDAAGLTVPDRVDPVLVPLVTGLVVLADWLASDLADRDPTVGEGGWQAHYERRLADARRSVTDLLGRPSRPAGDFADVFGFGPSRPVQQALVRPGPLGLRVVMAPTGDGKTEAALGHWLVNADERQGLFFALPTMATADAMFGRVRAFFATADETVGVLAHGRSILNQFYATTSRPLHAEVHDEPGGLRPGRWFTGNSRATLAPVTVGTADQALLGVLRHRYNVLRVAGLAGKTVVFDEVHSYDPYMALLLERFLTWAGELNIDVVLLSATLPRERLNAYLAAYGASPPGHVTYPAVVTATADGVDVTELDASQRATTIDLHHHPAADLLKGTVDLIDSLRGTYPDAKIGVIVNTVGRCQQVAAALVDRGERVDVMHARFPAAMRGQQVVDAVDWYGKDSTGGAAVMVATQVVEQSIDLDFDVLVTDLCPAASLVQRAGRTFRHTHDPARRSRPAGLTRPTVHVVRPDPMPEGLYGWLPYPAAAILQTWTAGLDSGARTAVRVPEDVQEVIDAAHVTFDTYLASIDTALEGAVEGQVLADAVARNDATQRVIPTPDGMRRDPIGGLTDYTAGADDVGQYQTRWIDMPSVDVLLVNGGPDTWTDPLPTSPSRAQVRDLLGCVVPLAGAPRTATAATVMTPDQLGLDWADTHLADVVVLDLTAPSAHRLDPLLGFIHGSTRS